MKDDPATGRTQVSFEELAYSNLVVVEALVQLLKEKGVLTHEEVVKKVQEVKATTKMNFVLLQ